MMYNALNVLLVEDDPGDVELTRDSLKDCKLNLNLAVVDDGEKAMAYLYKQGRYTGVPTPDVVLLDLNMPRKDGREVLREMREDPHLRSIPVVVLTTSEAEADVLSAYLNGANCYITKPIGLAQFSKVVHAISDFWFTVVKLPPAPVL